MLGKAHLTASRQSASDGACLRFSVSLNPVWRLDEPLKAFCSTVLSQPNGAEENVVWGPAIPDSDTGDVRFKHSQIAAGHVERGLTAESANHSVQHGA